MRALYLEVRNLCAKSVHTLANEKYHKTIFWGSFDIPMSGKALNLCLVILSGPRHKSSRMEVFVLLECMYRHPCPVQGMNPSPSMPTSAHFNSK